MPDSTYQLVFRGELLGELDQATVLVRLSAVLNLPADQAERLFSGSPVVVRRDADRATAARFQQAFKQAGARLRVVPNGPAGPPERDTGEAAAPRKTTLAERLGAIEQVEATSRARGEVPAPTAVAADGIALAPVGTPVLAEHERATAPPAAQALGELQAVGVAPAGTGDHADFALPKPAPVPIPDLSALRVEEAGATLPAPRTVPPLALSLDHLVLAEPGALLTDREPAGRQSGSDIDTSGLTLAPVGSPLGDSSA